MKRFILGGVLLFGIAANVWAQNQTAAAALSPPPKIRAKPVEKDPIKAVVAGNALSPNQAVTTEIYADEAFFDSANHIGTFTGHVIVKDPRFNVQAEKLTIYLSKGDAAPSKPGGPRQPQAFEKAVAEGNVGVVRDAPGENGGPPSRSIGRADVATYTTKDGNVELKGSPRVQSGLNTHVATSADTVMVINQSGQLTTRGPSRTEIRQEPKPPEGVKP
ncbi:MAG: LptA/OstA family protein [Verrucomicrobiota bacterium]|nr:LptA/OstA family protein [Verrucomicrobiota bacterium]